MIKYVSYLMLVLLFSCTSAEIQQTLGGILESGDTKPTTNEVISGLKDALIKGTNTGTAQASKLDGYFKNPNIKIPFPPEITNVETKLRQIGLGGEVDKFVKSLNRGAEQAAKEAAPIFVNAIRSLTIQDAWGILRGENDAATRYLERTSSGELYTKFKPVVDKSLKKVNATKYYSDLAGTYNKIPFVTKVNADLGDYATNKAIDGLFYLVEQEEAKIREDPIARTTDILKKVFGYSGD
ncbi:MAG: DUF4197 domain-containing protein [Bacteroidota bacterium]